MNNDKPRVPSKGPELSSAEQADHARSVRDYPSIDFSPFEYVVIDVRRSVWGLVRIWLFAIAIYLVIIAVSIIVNQTSPIDLPDTQKIALIALAAVVPAVAGAVGTYDYNQCSFIVTNERVIARMQLAPFSSQTQNCEIEHVRNCSYSQAGIAQTLLNYGSIKLATVAGEQDLLFTYVAQPREQFRIINRVVQQADEGQPLRSGD